MRRLLARASARAGAHSAKSFSSTSHTAKAANADAAAARPAVAIWAALEPKATEIMAALHARGERVAVAETSSGGLISASLLSSPLASGDEEGHRPFAGAGVRLPRGMSSTADVESKTKALEWGVNYDFAEDEKQSHAGSAIHALELAHAAKINLQTEWGIGESSVAGPDHSKKYGLPPGMGFVAVVGPDEERTGVLKIQPTGTDDALMSARMTNMARFAKGALDLMGALLKKT